MELILEMAEKVIGQVKSLVMEGHELGMQVKEMKEELEALKSVLPRREMDEKWVCEVRDLCYDADDLIDELVTLSRINKRDLTGGNTNGFRKVRLFFSHKLVLRWKAFVTVNHLLTRINALLQDLHGYGFGYGYAIKGSGLGLGFESGDSRNIKESRHIVSESSFLVGRDLDKESVVNLLLGNHDLGADVDSCSDDVDGPNFVVAIVGMGGVGKTALAEHIYHDPVIDREFQFKLWATVSGESDAARVVVSQLSQSEELSDRKFLVVLDDVWTERSEDWHELRGLMRTAAPKGSRCLLTTRSRVAATSLGHGPVYQLQCLSDPHSWELFERVAFPPGKRDPRLVDAGKRVVSRCAGLPLALRAVGSLLHGRGYDTWFSWENADFANTGHAEGVLPSLKLSYDHLSPPLKHCFSYCALFPKGRPMVKRSLIYQWMAQGFVSAVDGRTPEDAGEEYFAALLQRCFFHDIKSDSRGRITSCKMHDLLHDLASSMAGPQAFVAGPLSSALREQTRHLSNVGVQGDSFFQTSLPALKTIRTYLDFSPPTKIQPPIVNSSFLSSASHLRVLSVCNLNLCRLPDTVGQLLLLRYLDLSGNSQLELLPDSVTKLYNLQTLKLSGCLSLTELPHEFKKLVNLRHLELHECNKLPHMPLGFGALTCLDDLTMFVVGQQSYASVPDQLEVLKSLSNLKGSLKIKLQIGSSFNATEMRDSEYLKGMTGLEDLSIQWNGSDTLRHETFSEHEALLEGLKLQCHLRTLKLEGFPGMTLPSWPAFSTNLVNICLNDCPSLHHLPRLSQLPHLKDLLLHKLGNLEYMESDCFVSTKPSSRTADSSTFFPSLENLTLSHLLKLRGWWSVVGNGPEVGPYNLLGDHSFDRPPPPSFPLLIKLKIMECPKLISLPPCRQLEELHLHRFNEALQLTLSSDSKKQQHSLRRGVTLDNVGYIKHLPLEFHQCISYIAIQLSVLEDFSPGEEVFTGSLPFLRTLQVTLCGRLKSLSGLGWNHLASLQRLQLSNLPVLDLTPESGDGEEDAIPWNSLQSLQILELDFLPKLVDLPEGIQHLTALETLEISSCHHLKALPEWIGLLASLQSLHLEACTALNCLPDSMMQLTSLRNFEVLRCSEYLRQKCQQPMGVDWPKIRHIPHISVL